MKITESIRHLIKGDSKQVKLSPFTYDLILTKLESALTQKRNELASHISRPMWLEVEIKDLQNAITEFKESQNDK